jgi:hypothetical protein
MDRSYPRAVGDDRARGRRDEFVAHGKFTGAEVHAFTVS